MNDLEKELRIINLWIGKKLKKFVSLFNTLLVSTEILCIIICRNDPWIQFTSIHWTFCFSLEVSINNFAFLLLSCYLYIAWTDFFFSFIAIYIFSVALSLVELSMNWVNEINTCLALRKTLKIFYYWKFACIFCGNISRYIFETGIYFSF